MSEITVTITSFDPLAMELPAVDPIPSGANVRIQLPAHRVTYGTLDVLDWKISGDLQLFELKLTLDEPMERSALAALATEIAPLLQEMHAGLQAKIDERGALYGPGTLPSALQLAALATMWR